MKTITEYKERVVKVPSNWYFTCDNCGRQFEKGERKVTPTVPAGSHYCYDRPCSPFSKPKGCVREWSSDKQSYVWVKEQPND